MNKTILIGRLTKEPDLRYTTSGTAVATFTLAIDRPYKKEGEQTADFINIVVWNKPAENCAKYLEKGKQCAVEGRLQIRSYENSNGERRWVTEVVAERVEFIGNRSNEQRSEEADFGTEVYFDIEDVPFFGQ